MQVKTIRYVLVAAVVLAIGIPSAAIGFGEGRSLKQGKRNPSSNTSLSLSSETEIIASSNTYGTRQSNKKDGDGGGAIYGCRSSLGNEPCVRAVNLKGGRAFEFETVGKEAGRIEVGDVTGAPFTTNAGGVATGLNADRVDGKDSTELVGAGELRFAVVSAAGALGAKRGATGASITDPGEGRYTVVFENEVRNCSFTASPAGEANGTSLGVSAGADGKSVVVDQANAAEDRVGFHLQVIC